MSTGQVSSHRNFQTALGKFLAVANENRDHFMNEYASDLDMAIIANHSRGRLGVAVPSIRTAQRTCIATCTVNDSRLLL